MNVKKITNLDIYAVIIHINKNECHLYFIQLKKMTSFQLN